jgi:hypothetical protein
LEKVFKLKYPTINEGRKIARRKIKIIFLLVNILWVNIFIPDS